VTGGISPGSKLVILSEAKNLWLNFIPIVTQQVKTEMFRSAQHDKVR
jgi:hypothetical protein